MTKEITKEEFDSIVSANPDVEPEYDGWRDEEYVNYESYELGRIRVRAETRADYAPLSGEYCGIRRLINKTTKYYLAENRQLPNFD